MQLVVGWLHRRTSFWTSSTFRQQTLLSWLQCGCILHRFLPSLKPHLLLKLWGRVGKQHSVHRKKKNPQPPCPELFCNTNAATIARDFAVVMTSCTIKWVRHPSGQETKLKEKPQHSSSVTTSTSSYQLPLLQLQQQLHL